jgi:hypothetical protein
VTAICLLLAVAVRMTPDLREPEIVGPLLLIVGFAAYPFIVGIAAETISRLANNKKYSKRFATIMVIIGVVPAVLLNYPQPRVYAVAPLAGFVLVLCFAATGALIGSLIDLKNRSREQN